MKFTYTWLKEHLETEKTPAEIAEKLTALGLEIEEFTDMGAVFEPFLVAEILEAEKHPNADKLQVCKVSDGSQELQIVCGAPNARKGIKVCLAPVGAYIPAAAFKIKKSKIRDVESNGMLCSSAELGLGEDSEGIMELDETAKIGSKYSEYANLNDSFYEIAITPNRQDCLGVRGIARDLAAAGYGKLNPLDHPAGLSNHSLKSPVTVTSSSYYIGRYFKDMKNAQSPAWLKNRLTSIGLEPISALVDITNYITFDLGRPLHVYDADKLKGNLTIREAKKGEKINALNNKEYELQGFEPVIADQDGVLALGGVIGNIESSVDENTKNIFLEVAYFDPDEIAKAGRTHQIDSDARYRFERGIDPDFLITGTDLATKMILDICGGETSEMVTSGEKPEWHKEIEFDFAKVKTLGGIDIPQKDCEAILVDLGFAINNSKIEIPSWRRDIVGSADLVEEILRINGYEKVEPQILPFTGKSDLPHFASQKDIARNTLASRGQTEAITYSFLCESAANGFGGGGSALKISNPISSELSDMRPSILPNLLEASLNNSNRGTKNIALFEIGPIFAEDGEQQTITSLRVGKNAEKNIYGDSRKIDVFDAKADILAVLENLGAPEAQIRTDNLPKYYHPGRSAGLYLGKNCLGYFGEIHPATLKTCDISDVAVGFEIFLSNIPKSKTKYKQLIVSDFQPTARDFAFIVPAQTQAGELARRVQKLDDLITDCQIFDVFEGKNIEEGKKSIAFSVNLQPTAATLTDEEIEKISSAIISFVEKEFSGILRK